MNTTPSHPDHVPNTSATQPMVKSPPKVDMDRVNAMAKQRREEM